MPDLVLVTGVAGSSGKAAVRALAARGVGVVGVDRRPLTGPEAGAVAAAFTFDLVDEDAFAAAAERIAGLGQLRHVFAVAGGADLAELSHPDQPTQPLDLVRTELENNLVSAFATVRHAVPLLRRVGGDRSITLVSSINAAGGYRSPGYSAAKAGLVGMANALVTDLGADGIRINTLMLGTVDTETSARLTASLGTADGYLDRMSAGSPLGRVLSADEVGAALCALAFDLPGLTGSTLVLDNGQLRKR